jgi:hypothetical protein
LGYSTINNKIIGFLNPPLALLFLIMLLSMFYFAKKFNSTKGKKSFAYFLAWVVFSIIPGFCFLQSLELKNANRGGYMNWHWDVLFWPIFVPATILTSQVICLIFYFLIWLYNSNKIKVSNTNTES